MRQAINDGAPAGPAFQVRHGRQMEVEELMIARRTDSGWESELVRTGRTHSIVAGNSELYRAGLIAWDTDSLDARAVPLGHWTTFFERTPTGWIEEDLSGLEELQTSIDSSAGLVLTDGAFVFVVPGEPPDGLMIAVRSGFGAWRVARHPLLSDPPWGLRLARSGSDALIAVSMSQRVKVLKVTPPEAVATEVVEIEANLGAVDITDGESEIGILRSGSEGESEFILLDPQGVIRAREMLQPTPGGARLVFDSSARTYRVVTGMPRELSISVHTRGPAGWTVETLELDPLFIEFRGLGP